MRRIPLILALFCLAALSFGLTPASSQQTTETFSVCQPDKTGYEKGVDVALKGFSAGDYSVFQDPIYDRGTGKLIGRSYGRATFVKVTKNTASFILETTFNIRDRGKIVTYNATRFAQLDKGKPEPVIGGTRQFANARGIASTTEGKCAPGKKGARIKFELILD